MMKLQDEIIQKFNQTFNQPTLQTVVELTGINLTRVFRLYNGYDMKVKEYEAFKRAIEKETSSPLEVNLKRQFDFVLTSFSKKSLEELSSLLNQKIDLIKITGN